MIAPERQSSTTAQLKDDIVSGRTGDKVVNADPGLAPLGTDDEAGGNAYSGQQADLARRTEAKPFSAKADTDRGGKWVWLLIGVIVVSAALFIAVLAIRH